MTPFHFRSTTAITRTAPAARGSMLRDAVAARALAAPRLSRAFVRELKRAWNAVHRSAVFWSAPVFRRFWMEPSAYRAFLTSLPLERRGGTTPRKSDRLPCPGFAPRHARRSHIAVPDGTSCGSPRKRAGAPPQSTVEPPIRRNPKATGDIPNSNREIPRKLPGCYQMLPSFGSISKLRVATNSGKDAIRVSKMRRKTSKKLPNATIRGRGARQLIALR